MYADWMGVHFLLLEYQRVHKHPSMDLHRDCWVNLNGEDIELANRALSHCTKSTSGQSNVKFLHRRTAC